MKIPNNIDRPCVIMTGFASHRPCFLKPLFRLFTQGRKITMLEHIQLVIVGFHNTQRGVRITSNHIYDISDNSENSHLKKLPESITSAFSQLNTKEFVVNDVICKKLTNIMKKSASLKEKLVEIEKVMPANNKERRQKEIYRFILNQQLYKEHMFSNAYINTYSEEDFKLKFWSHVFEEIFGYGNINLKWGDTVPGSLTKTNVISRLDLRVSYLSTPLDFSMTEFAKKCVSSKYYLDKLKLVLISKLHLNALVSNIECEPTDIYVPLMLVMGFDYHLLHLRLVQPKQYVVVNIIKTTYPITKAQINNGGIDNLINTLSYIKSNALDLKAKIDQAKTMKNVNKIDDLLGTSHTNDTGVWQTKVTWPDMSILEDNCDWNADICDDQVRDDDEEEEDDDEEDDEKDDDDEDNRLKIKVLNK